VTERVTRVLRKRGALPATIDDAVQTAVLRALCRTDGFDRFAGLINWVTVVAWHEVQAEWRQLARIELGAVPEQPTEAYPADVLETRLVVNAVVDGLSVVTPDEREAILAPLAEDAVSSNGPDDARTRMRRHRARQRLAGLVEQAEPSR
jgi:DNA-directed RNA polymerase specialized sigma24 family protein